MVKIIERYLHHESSDSPLHAPLDANASWLDDEMSTLALDENFNKNHIVALSSSAIDFVTTQSPVRERRKDLSQQEARDDDENLLGIDDDGSLLLPLHNQHQHPIENSFSGQTSEPFRDSSVFDDPMSSFEL